MKVDIAGTIVDLDQLELADDEIVVDAMVIARVQRVTDDDETLSVAASDGLSYFVQLGVITSLLRRLEQSED